MKIFISYQHNVWPLAKTIADWLKPKGHDVYWDFESLKHGSAFNEAIASLIADSDQIIFLASPDALNSKWVCAELAYGKALQKSVMPIKLEGVTNEQIESVPFLGKIHVLNWPTGHDISDALVTAMEKVDNQGLLKIDVFKFKADESFFEVYMKNVSNVDFYDLHYSVCVEIPTLPSGFLLSENSERDVLVLTRGREIYPKFKIEDFIEKKEVETFYTSGKTVIVLCKFCFQNQERHFYVSKSLKLETSIGFR